MSNSSLATYVDRSTGNWNYRKHPISRITIHHAAGVCNMSSFSSILRSGREVSYNYAIANDGTIGLFVDEDHRAWTSSSPDNDHRAITIEVSNSSIGGQWPISAPAFNSLIRLCEDICRRNKISKLTYTGQLAGSNLTMHQWFTSTLCPGPYLKSKFGEIANTVNKRLGNPGQDIPTDSNNSYSNAVTGGLISQSDINYNYLNPYIITLSRYSNDIDYSQLVKNKIVGAVVECGHLYNSIHQEQYYRNPKLDDQCNSLTKHHIPYGLYCKVQARSIEEANRELYELSFCIRKYPPVLGMWLNLQLTKSKSENTNIVKHYYKRLVKLGLKDKVGLYVTRPQLKTIDWPSLNNMYYLWIIDHIDNVNNIDQLLTPQFFVT